MNSVAIILARGGSKGIPGKNIMNFCGKPLLAWTIEHCLEGGCSSVWVSSDSEEILAVAEKFGAQLIKRPDEISGDTATSESGWEHAINYIEEITQNAIDWVVAPQVTSPLREAKDIKRGMEQAESGKWDSMFSCSVVEDLFFWESKGESNPESVNYDWRNRKRRQDIPEQFIENGSFYLFKPQVLIENKNRFGGRIGYVKMEFWKMFEIDGPDDVRMCSALMYEFLADSEKVSTSE
jgi:N-acylneuraminate cytidylyltransferase